MSLIANSIKGSLNVITGCGSGLGRATLQWFLKHDCGPVLAVDRYFEKDYIDKLDLTVDQKAKIDLKQHDTFDEIKVESSLSEFVAKNGTIDNLINVAGVSLAFTFIVENKDPSKRKVYDIRHARDLVKFNTVGTFNMIRQASRYMMDSRQDNAYSSRSKCIINTSCISTTKPSVGQSFQAASNSAIDSMTLCIARDLAPFNIRCNTINVGYFATDLLVSNNTKVTEYLEKEVIVCPKRLGQPDEFAHLVQAIVENQMLNGACIRIDAATGVALERPGGPRSVVDE